MSPKPVHKSPRSATLLGKNHLSFAEAPHAISNGQDFNDQEAINQAFDWKSGDQERASQDEKSSLRVVINFLNRSSLNFMK